MDVKTFIAAPESGLTSLGISILDTRGRELLTLAEQLTELKSCLKEAKKNKAEVARQFKTLEQSSDQREPLIAAMQLVSADIKDIEEKLKKT